MNQPHVTVRTENNSHDHRDDERRASGRQT